MPKYDAFGREIGEDTLEGLGGTPDRKPRPEPPRPEPARARAPVPGPEAPARPEAPDTAQRQALAAQLRGALQQAAAARETATGPVVRRSTARRGCLVALVLAFAMAGLAVAGVVLLVGSVKTEIEAGGSSGTIRLPTEKSAAPPRGLGPRSLVRKANLAAALKKLRGSELRLTNLRVAPERINATLLTRGGRLRHVQVQPGGALKRFGSDSGPGFDATRTIPFARLRPAAPQRLTRQGATKLNVPVSTVQYVVPSLFGDELTWTAYFKRGRYVIGDAAGRWQRTYE